MIHLEITPNQSGRNEERRFDAVDGAITIGRDPESTIPLATQAISRKHTTIEPAPDGWVIIDHSTLGTTLNDKPLENEKATLLADGDRIGLHETIIRITILGTRAEPDKEEEYADNLMQLVDDVKKDVEGSGRIEVLHAGKVVGNVPLGEEGSSLLIGRSKECEVQVDDPLRLVSGVHARLEREWAGAFLYDLSRNGVFVNGMKVEDCAPLAPGDRITLALAEEQADGLVLVYLEKGESARPVSPSGPEVAADPELVENVTDKIEEAPSQPTPSQQTTAQSPQVETPHPPAESPDTTPSSPSQQKAKTADDEGRKKGDPPAAEKVNRAAGQGAFFWIVVAVVAVVVVLFAIIGFRVIGG